MRLLGLFLLLAVLVIVPFVIWGDSLTERFSVEAAVRQMESWGAWGWAAGLGLLIADLFLPIPGTAVMSALGYLYGWFLGGLLSALGSVLSGLLAYSLCRTMGQSAAEFIAGRSDLEKARRLFSKAGGWVVAWSRWLPILPEVVACLAGMVKMRFSTFFAALICGGLPLGFAFAAIGDIGRQHMTTALISSAVIPPLLWLIVKKILHREPGER